MYLPTILLTDIWTVPIFTTTLETKQAKSKCEHAYILQPINELFIVVPFE